MGCSDRPVSWEVDWGHVLTRDINPRSREPLKVLEQEGNTIKCMLSRYSIWWLKV